MKSSVNVFVDMPIHVSVYHRVPGGRREQQNADGGEREGQSEWKKESSYKCGGATAKGGISQSFLQRGRGMNIPVLPCSLETAASSFGGSAACVCFQPDYLHDVFYSFICSDGRKMAFWQADNEA